MATAFLTRSGDRKVNYSPPYRIAPMPRLELHFRPDHWADLKKSGLGDEVIKQAGVYSLSPNRIAEFFSFSGKTRILPDIQSALCFPYQSGGFARIKIFPDHGKMRYVQPPLTSARLYMPVTPSGGKIVICEGEKKTLAALQHGLNAVGIGGVWSWMSKGHAIDDLEKIKLEGADIEIVPDSDVWSRPDLLRAIYALGREVESRGAFVEVVQIPGEGKVGLDDYFASGGTIEGYENMDRVQLRQPSLKVFRSWYTRWRVAKELAA